MLPFLSNQTQSFPTGMLIQPKELWVCQHSEACSPQGVWSGPRAQAYPSFQSLLEEAIFFYNPGVLYKYYFQ